LLTSFLSSGWVASIPSPSFNTIDLGPRPLTLYGLMIGLGIIAATMISRPRVVARGMHADTPVEMLMWVVPAGVVGARMYHVITDSVSVSDWHKIWEGGLGIPGGILGGAAGALLFIKRRDMSRPELLDAIVPGVALAQAIGRWGNWWNQELYGRPTDLPWGLEIDAEHRISGFGEFETFHPTFLYESLWSFGLCGFLIWLDQKKVLKPGKLVWVYTGSYAIGRLWIEALRIDPATEIAGVRVNLWTMGLVVAVSAFFLRNGFKRRGSKERTDLSDDYAEDRVADDRSAASQPGVSDEEE
jgi:prolipoprotein diacylglyceryl transferase